MSSEPPETLANARQSFANRVWAEAWSLFNQADQDSPLPPEDLDRLGVAAHLIGRASDSANAWTRAHKEHLARGEWERAASCALKLGLDLMHTGQRVRAQGWLAQAERVLDEHGCAECAERGHLL